MNIHTFILLCWNICLAECLVQRNHQRFSFDLRHSTSTGKLKVQSRRYCLGDDYFEEQEQEQDVPVAATVKSLFYSKKDFKEVGYSDKMIGVMNSLGMEKPSKIQSLSFKEVYNKKSCVIADQTGSGKTLSYLIPSIQRMIEYTSDKKNAALKSRSPFIVIITPTQELAVQVSKVVKSLANALKFRTSCITSASDKDKEQKKLRLGVEVLVATPGRLLDLINKKDVLLDDTQVMVLDEVDVLFLDQSFPLQPIGAACPLSTQFIFTTATLPEVVAEQIRDEFPDSVAVRGPGLHRIAPNIEEVLIDCSGPRTQKKDFDKVFDNKRLALLKSILTTDAERTIIFCNSIDQCRKVENILERDDRNQKQRSVFAYHGAIDNITRERNLVEFTRTLLRQPAILISTDRSSRGMDFNKEHVDHVILFDFPQEPSEYLRRVGRTGRAGRDGKATVLVYGRQVDTAKVILQASIDGKRIEPSDRL